jgi:uncharacterized membrane protein YhaH (DUF805 family)
MAWYLMVWKRYAQFTGRSRRTEYWMFSLIHAAVFVAIEILALALAAVRAPGAIIFVTFTLCFLYAFAALVPYLAVSVRRLHDVGKSGWWMLLSFLPLLDLLLIVFFCFDSELSGNHYGPNPKSPAPYTVTS